MPIRIQIARQEWFPVQAFFNSIPDMDFIQTIRQLGMGISRGFDVCHCDFPDDLEIDDPPFEGVRFTIFEEEVTVSRSEFASILRSVCEIQKTRCPDQAHALDTLMAAMDTEGRLES